jgi:hypothetical protein
VALALGALVALGDPSAAQSEVAGWGRFVVDTVWNQEAFAEVGTGYWHTLARRTDGSIVAWGENAFDQCAVPPLPPGLVAVEVDGGDRGSFALLSDGSLVFWGLNLSGVGDVPPLPPGLTYVEVAGSQLHAAARRSDGSVVAWGSNSSGQCNVPALPAGLVYVEIAVGDVHTVARRSDGSVVAWGSNLSGQCSVPPPPAGHVYVEVAAGGYHSMARYAPAVPPGVYCTAKVNSLGCTPAIASSGAASATAGTGFQVTGVDLLNNKSGFLFYGVNGPAALPFYGGTKCVDPPTKRTPVQSSLGTPAPAADCSGIYALDLNAFAVGALGGVPEPLLTAPGTTVNCQWWGRDPGNNSMLSDALECTIGL